jgi:hypothetical protein
MRGSVMSLTNWARPRARRVRFGRGTERPIYEFGPKSRSVGFSDTQVSIILQNVNAQGNGLILLNARFAAHKWP